jgi:hypothetical protein
VDDTIVIGLTNGLFPFHFVLVVHIVTPETTEAEENFSSN